MIMLLLALAEVAPAVEHAPLKNVRLSDAPVQPATGYTMAVMGVGVAHTYLVAPAPKTP